MPFQENIKTARKAKQLSQEELAELLDVSRQAVSKWEQGICMPEAQMLMQISDKLGISLDKLMSDSIISVEDGSDANPSCNPTASETDCCKHKNPKTKTPKSVIMLICGIVLCVSVIAVIISSKNEKAPVDQPPLTSPVVENTRDESTAPDQHTTETETSNESAPTGTNNTTVFTTEQDRERLSELATDFAYAYFAQDFDTLAKFLSPYFVGNPKDVSPWDGVDTFFIRGVDAISTEKADGLKRISIEFRNPDYPDSFLYLSIDFKKEDNDWKVYAYYLEP